MSIYLATFGKLNYIGLIKMEEAEGAETSVPRHRPALLQTMRGLEIGLVGGRLSPEQEKSYREACSENSGGEQTRGPEPMLQEVELVEYADAGHLEELRRCRNDEEQALVKRARNHRSMSRPQHADPKTYKIATGFEALLGYLYLADERQRLREIAAEAVRIVDGTERK